MKSLYSTKSPISHGNALNKTNGLSIPRTNISQVQEVSNFQEQSYYSPRIRAKKTTFLTDLPQELKNGYKKKLFSSNMNITML